MTIRAFDSAMEFPSRARAYSERVERTLCRQSGSGWILAEAASVRRESPENRGILGREIT
jgi:hypothetical protein